ncbi:MAG: hypothetical protein HY243_17935 [Proteobacteria bacterium]|nr:hypothetical protein [Pseudomonadota bacterium]
MRKVLSAAIVTLIALGLSGCFVSDKPLFDTKSAAYPFADGTHYIQYFTDDKGGWKEHGRGTVTIKDGWYFAVNKGEHADGMYFLLMAWGRNYLAEIKTENDKKQTMYMYGVLSPGGGGFLEYGAECSKFDPASLQKKGLITYKPGEEDNCHPTSLAALKTLMGTVLAKAKPDNKYVVVK